MTPEKKYLLSFSIGILHGLSVFGQKDSIIRYERHDSLISQKYKCHLYLSIEEGQKEPLNVKCLDLKSQGFKEFPKEILNFQNLEFLDLSAHDRSALYSERLKAREIKEQYKKEHPNSIIDEATLLIGQYNPNKITKIPSDIRLLTKLKWLDVSDTDLSKKEVKRLKQLLPNCQVVSDFDE